jgi:hypothetical protein
MHLHEHTTTINDRRLQLSPAVDGRIISTIKSRRMKCMGHKVCMGEIRSEVQTGKSKGRIILEVMLKNICVCV